MPALRRRLVVGAFLNSDLQSVRVDSLRLDEGPAIGRPLIPGGEFVASDVDQLRSAAVGDAPYPTSWIHGPDRCRTARVFVALSEPVASPVELRLPDDGTVVYVQRAGGFELLPKDAALVDEVLVLDRMGFGAGPTTSARVGNSTVIISSW